MSREICHRDQDRLDYIFEQVKALSDVVDALRTEVNDLKKVSLSAKREDVLFECTKVNCEVDHVRPHVVDNVKTCLKNVRDLTATEKICQLAENKVFKSDSTSTSYMVQSKRGRYEESSFCKSSSAKIISSTIYNGLKSFKNKLVKIIHNVPAPQLFLKSSKDNCVKSNEQRQIRFSREEEKRKISEFNRENENDVSKCIDIKDEFDDSTNTSVTSNETSVQTDITHCSCQEDNKKPTYSSRRDVMENDVQSVSPLSLMSDNRLIIRSNWITGESLKGRAKRAFLKNKSRKYKICSCGRRCPYALYKLPCCDQNNVLKKKTHSEDGGLTLECSSFEEKNNFPKFVNIDPGREKCECFAEDAEDFTADESSISSLSVDLELDICGDYGEPERSVEEFSKQRTMTHVIRRTSARINDNAINYFRTENKPPMCVNLEANQQGYRTKTKDFTHDYRAISGNDKQVQCSSATLRAIRKAPAGTSTLDFRRNGSANRSCRTMDTTKRTNFFKVIPPRQPKMNMHTQTERRSYFNRLRAIDLSAALGLGHEQDTPNINEHENERIPWKRNMCDTYHLSKQKIWSRAEGHNALRMEEDDETNSNKSWDQTGYFNYQRDGMTPMRTSCPYHCDRVLAEKHENFATLMSHFAEYHPSHRTLDFDMSNVSGKLYGCFEKLEDITS